MSERIEIPAGGGQIVHVFGLDLTGPEAEAFVRKPTTENGAGWPLKVALGARQLEPAHIEHIRVGDLAGIGLTGYLTEGLGLDPEAVEAGRDRLDALRGEVVILRPAAFGGEAQTLTVEPPLIHAGGYPELKGATTMEPLRSPSAEGHLSQPAAPSTPTPRAVKWMAAIAAAIVVIGLLIALTGGFR
ncbi:hypothetical protein [Oceanicola sp. 22II-s10i]|uniref:hypothetical protein n=1 Tax=Oceanicola sp. 22II-s10i TaxID=1317116 RepID=UPI000B522DF9|nr:hypothetical protein [Oceanicola sp. 22II-s10i]